METSIPKMFLHEPSETLDFTNVNVKLKILKAQWINFYLQLKMRYRYRRILTKWKRTQRQIYEKNT